MVDFVLEDARHEASHVHCVLFALCIVEGRLHLDGPLDQHHLVVVADTTLPRQAHILRIGRDPRIQDRLKLLELAACVPVLARTYQEDRHVWLANLGRSDAHPFAFPEARGVAQLVYAEVDGVEHLLIQWLEAGDLVNASLVQNLAAFLQEGGLSCQ